MDAAADALALVMLSELRFVGERGAHAVLTVARERGLSLAATLALPSPALARDCGLGAGAIVQLTAQRAAYVAHCRTLLAELQRHGAAIGDTSDARYPARWRERATPPPPLVYWCGNPGVLHAPTLAVLNSRTITAGTVGATIRLVRRAGAEGYTIVTGGMKSAYRIAAVAARATDAPRAMVLDRGLFAAFPRGLGRDPSGFGPNHSPLDHARTVVLSPFRLRDHAAPHNGRRRDHLTAALADVVIAANARAGGEIERVCLRALDAGQCVLSWLGENPGLVAAGARVIDETDLERGLRRFAPQPSAPTNE
jgi:predicted Rossmann fold nucleotide-binding protein DprA/Smf involved in DNA uptake